MESQNVATPEWIVRCRTLLSTTWHVKATGQTLTCLGWHHPRNSHLPRQWRNMEKSNWFYLNPPTKIEHLSTYACWSWHEIVWFLAAPPIDSNHTKKWYWQKLRCGWRLHTCSGFKNHIRRHIRRLCKFLQNLLLPFHLGKFQRPIKLP